MGMGKDAAGMEDLPGDHSARDRRAAQAMACNGAKIGGVTRDLRYTLGTMITGATIAILFLLAGIVAFMYLQKGAM